MSNKLESSNSYEQGAPREGCNAESSVEARVVKSAQGEDRRTIYEQDMQSVRYHDAAKWNRFQTVSVIEGAALYASFGSELSWVLRMCALILATGLIAMVFVIAIVDDRITASYLDRVREFEHAAGAPYRTGKTRPFLRLRMSRVLMTAILVFNAAALVWLGS